MIDIHVLVLMFFHFMQENVFIIQYFHEPRKHVWRFLNKYNLY